MVGYPGYCQPLLTLPVVGAGTVLTEGFGVKSRDEGAAPLHRKLVSQVNLGVGVDHDERACECRPAGAGAGEFGVELCNCAALSAARHRTGDVMLY